VEKQTFDTRKMIGILLLSFFLVSITGASASAKNNTANYMSLCNNPACGGNVIVSDDINISNSTRLCSDLACVVGGIGSDKLQDTKADIRTF
jgi:hypothetical protein